MKSDGSVMAAHLAASAADFFETGSVDVEQQYRGNYAILQRKVWVKVSIFNR